jgi:uncharacterized membrane protein YeiH
MPTQFLHIIDILGTFAFAVSGAFLAMEKKLDPFGVLVIAFVTAIGGGTLRDVLIGNLPVSWLKNDTAIYVILGAATATLFFGRYLRQLTTTLFVFDALGLGLFTLAGLEMGLARGYSMGICISLGTITACFGGVVRDVLLNTIPLLFRKEIYALACIAGGLVYFGLHRLGLTDQWMTLASIAVVVAIRVIAFRFHLSLPAFYAAPAPKS